MANFKKLKELYEKHPVFITLSLVCIVVFIVLVNILCNGAVADVINDGEEAVFTPPSENVAELPDGKIDIHFIDVGQGDAMLIGNEDGEFMLIDAGGNDGVPALLSYIRDAGAEKLECVILTHPHEDHIGGADAVLRNFETKALYMPELAAFTPAFDDLMRVLERNDRIEIAYPVPGESFEFGDAEITFISPKTVDTENYNNSSIVTVLEYAGKRVLFTGDIEAFVEAELLKSEFNLDCDILKVAHHGSSTSSTRKFIEAVSPELAVISCGIDNDYGHPHRETKHLFKELSIPYYRTDLHGSVVISFDGEGNMEVESGKEWP